MSWRDKKNKSWWHIGIGFWSGVGIYSLINLIMNLSSIPQDKILIYNYIITGAAIAGIIFNVVMSRRRGD